MQLVEAHTELEGHVAYLRSQESDYVPNERVAEELRNAKHAILVIGPIAVGKTTVMGAISQLDADFQASTGFTTRERRPGESDEFYEFIPHDVEHVTGIVDEVWSRDLVQFAVHPTTKSIYGSRLPDYEARYPMLDILSSSVEQFRRLPFEERTEFAVVASSEEWWQRVRKRMELTGLEETKKRVAEAELSLEWSLSQGNALAWINNKAEGVRTTAQEIINITKRVAEPDPRNRVLGEQLLKRIRVAKTEL